MHDSVAERFVYGTPLHQVDEEARILNRPRNFTALIGRLLLAVIFLEAGLTKFANPSGAISYMNSAGIPHADVLVYVAACAELLGGLSLVFGFLARLGAMGLIVMLAITTYYFHRYWTMEGAQAQMQMINFYKNLAIGGGLFTIVAHGPGRWSIDARIRRPFLP